MQMREDFMLRRKNHFMPWMLSALLCFSNSFAVIQAEEETPAEEEEVQEILEEESFEEEPVLEEVPEEEQEETVFSEEEIPETEETVLEETSVRETEEEPVLEAEEEPELPEDEPAELTEEEASEAAAGDVNCGENITWSINEGVLTLSGSGAMYDYDTNENPVPWIEERNTVEKVVIEDGITSIGNYAFWEFTSLKEISIPDGVKKIGDYAFYDDFNDYNSRDQYAEFTLPSALEYIGDCAFYRNTYLPFSSAEIPSGVTYIGGLAFSSCARLSGELVLPEGLGEIKDHTFSYSGISGSLVIPSSVVSIGYDAFARVGITSLTLSEGVKSVGEYTFDGCHLKEINFPDSLERIGTRSFRDAQVTELVIPKGITFLGYESFEGAGTLKKVTFNGDVPETGGSVFRSATAMGYYPEDNETWTKEARDSFSGNFASVIWVEYERILKATFIVVGTDYQDVIEVSPGSYLERPELTGEEGYYLSDWYTSEEMTDGTKWDFETDTVTDDVALYAKWEPVKVTSITVDPSEAVLVVNETLQISFTIEPENALNKNVIWTSDDEETAAVDENGLVTALRPGTATITVTAEDGNKKASCMITVRDKDPLPGIYIKGLEASYTYIGKAIKPAVEVYDTGVLLTPKTDYTVTYKNTTKAYTIADPEHPTAKDKKSAPQITIKSVKNGNYTGSKTVYFSIEPLDFSDEQITVDDLSVQVGTKAVTAVPAVYLNGRKLKNKTDYKVNYGEWDRKEPGKHTITVEGKGNFKGTREVNVYAASKEYVSVAKLTVTAKTLKYADLTAENFAEKVIEAVTVKNGKKKLTYGEDYLIFGLTEDNRKVGTHAAALVLNDEKGYYGTKSLTIKITGTSLKDKKVKVNKPTYFYTGEEITLGEDFSITYNTVPLVKGEDYIILEDSYQNNINSGTASVSIEGINGYTGTRTVSYLIRADKEQLTADYVQMRDSFEYLKGGVKPEPVVPGLKKGTDYTVTYKNNTKVGTGTATISFKGNYKGVPSITKQFEITPKPIDTVTMTAKDKVYSSKANAYKSAPVLKDTDGKTLKAGVDYEKVITYTTEDDLELPSVVAAGMIVKVTVTGKGNYTGSASTIYRILETGKDISKATFKIAAQEYTGREILITDMDQFSETKGQKNAYVTVNKKKVYLTLGEEFEVVPGSYVKNVAAGTAKVTFRGIGEYGGEKTVSFKIKGKGLLAYWFDGYGKVTISGYNTSYMDPADVTIEFAKAKAGKETLKFLDPGFDEIVEEEVNVIRVKPGSKVKIDDALGGDTTDSWPFALTEGHYEQYARGITISSGNVSDWPTTIFNNGDVIGLFMVCLKDNNTNNTDDYFIIIDK